MRILGIETSCDETAAAVVSRSSSGEPEIRSNIILSQTDTHAQFGGVVPELAARAHLGQLDRIISTALAQADTALGDIDGIGVTAGPGLTGGLLVGTVMARAIAASSKLPCIPINHLEGHALTARLTDNVSFPYLLLLVSGGHSQILLVRSVGDYSRWATTIDDAVGECFDKTAKLLGLPYPGGPSVEKCAAEGDASRFEFPRPLAGKNEMMMSFSGLKTAVRQKAESLAPLKSQDVSDICAGLQAAITDILVDRCRKSIQRFNMELPETSEPRLVVAGGVAANQQIRLALKKACDETGWRLVAPPLSLCTDNAAMIGWAALERFETGRFSTEMIAPRPRWPLDEHATSVIGSGRKGAKA